MNPTFSRAGSYPSIQAIALGIALMSLVNQQHKRSPFQLCERWIFQQR
jgi:hypothetical protein